MIDPDTSEKQVQSAAQLSKGTMIAKIVKRLAGKQPHLHIDQTSDSLSLIFTFRGCFPRELRHIDAGSHQELFAAYEAQQKGWAHFLMEAYEERLPKEKPINQWFQYWLYHMQLRASAILLAKAKKAGSDNQRDVEAELKTLETEGRRSSGRPRRAKEEVEGTAIKRAKRYAELQPETDKFRLLVNQHSALVESELLGIGQEQLGYAWIRLLPVALNNLPRKENDAATRSYALTGKWAPWQLSVGLIYAEEMEQHPDTVPGPDRIYKSILFGNKLLENNSNNAAQ
jgi:hypothetical protein